jgi:uncharacterized protein YjbJ (UPF0337 family)
MAGEREQITGTAKEWEGKLTGDRAREMQGRAERTGGKLKDRAEDVKDKVEDTARDVRRTLTQDRHDDMEDSGDLDRR